MTIEKFSGNKFPREFYVPEEANAPADLSKRIIFKKNKIPEAESDAGDKPVKKKIKKTKQERAVLSFNEDDDDYL